MASKTTSGTGAPPCVRYVIFEGLLRALDIRKGSPEMKEALRLVGDGTHAPELIELERFKRLLTWLADRYYPLQSPEAALRQLGRRHIEGYSQTLLGAVQFAAARLVKPEAFVQRVPNMLRSNLTFGTYELVRQGERVFVLQIRKMPWPIDFLCGEIETGARMCGALNFRIELRRLSSEDFDLTLSADAPAT